LELAGEFSISRYLRSSTAPDVYLAVTATSCSARARDSFVVSSFASVQTGHTRKCFVLYGISGMKYKRNHFVTVK
jgi:hypothetical protein